MVSCFLTVSRSRLKLTGGEAFSVAASKLWNALPPHIVLSPSLPVLKSNLKMHWLYNPWPLALTEFFIVLIFSLYNTMVSFLWFVCLINTFGIYFWFYFVCWTFRLSYQDFFAAGVKSLNVYMCKGPISLCRTVVCDNPKFCYRSASIATQILLLIKAAYRIPCRRVMFLCNRVE